MNRMSGKEMVQVLIQSLHLQQDAFAMLDKVERNKKEILNICDEISKLEKAGLPLSYRCCFAV